MEWVEDFGELIDIVYFVTFLIIIIINILYLYDML